MVWVTWMMSIWHYCVSALNEKEKIIRYFTSFGFGCVHACSRVHTPTDTLNYGGNKH